MNRQILVTKLPGKADAPAFESAMKRGAPSDGQEAVAAACRTQLRHSVITGAGDKVQVLGAVSAMQSGRHGTLSYKRQWYPPLQRTQERGTPRFRMGKRLCVKGWATRQKVQGAMK